MAFKLKDIRTESKKYRFKSQFQNVAEVISLGIKQKKRGKKWEEIKRISVLKIGLTAY